MSKNKREVLIGVLLGLFIVFSFIIFVNFPRDRRVSIDKEKIIVRLNDNFDLAKNKDISTIPMPDCSTLSIDYNDQKGTVIYSNNKQEVIELDLKTGKEREIKILKPEANENSDENEIIRNIRYHPECNNFSYTYNDNLYRYDLLNNKLDRIAESRTNINNVYEWYDKTQLFILDNDYIHMNMYKMDLNTNDSELIEPGVASFILNGDKKKIYCVKLYSHFNGISIEMNYKIIEINLENETRTVLTDIKSYNFLLYIIDDKYLFYVKENSGKKISKLYCYDLKTKKNKCIFKTEYDIVGIIM